MNKFTYIIILLMISVKLNAQEIKFGLVTGSILFQNINDTNKIYTPDNSYYTFTAPLNNENLINNGNTRNMSLNLGLRISGFYKKFSFNLEPQYFYKRSTISFSNDLNWSIVGRGYRMPIYLTYKLFKKPRSIYFLTGLSLTKVKNYDYQTFGIGYNFEGEPIYNGLNNYGYNLFNNYLYTNNIYTNLIFGFGKPLKKMDFSIRMMKQNNSKNNPIKVNIWQIEFEVSWHILSSKDITKKHFLYVE